MIFIIIIIIIIIIITLRLAIIIIIEIMIIICLNEAESVLPPSLTQGYWSETVYRLVSRP